MTLERFFPHKEKIIDDIDAEFVSAQPFFFLNQCKLKINKSVLCSLDFINSFLEWKKIIVDELHFFEVVGFFSKRRNPVSWFISQNIKCGFGEFSSLLEKIRLDEIGVVAALVVLEMESCSPDVVARYALLEKRSMVGIAAVILSVERHNIEPFFR